MQDTPIKAGRVGAIAAHYTPEILRSAPNTIFVFGDNMQRKGKGGQAAVRDEPNAFGIPTKFAPSNAEGSFFTQAMTPEQKREVWETIKKDIDTLAQYKAEGKDILLPKNGIGTGLAQLGKHNPQLMNALIKELQNKLGFKDNNPAIQAMRASMAEAVVSSENTKPIVNIPVVDDTSTIVSQNNLEPSQLDLFGSEDMELVVETDAVGNPTEQGIEDIIEEVPENQLRFKFAHDPNIDLSDMKASTQALRSKMGEVAQVDMDSTDPVERAKAIEVEMFARNRGVSLTDNLVATYGQWKDSTLIPHDKLKALYDAMSAKKANLDTINKAIEDITGKPATTEDIEFWAGYISIYQSFSTRLQGKQRGLIRGLAAKLPARKDPVKNKEDREFRLFTRLSPVLNFFKFVWVKENNFLGATAPTQLVQAMTNAVMFSVIEQTGKTNSASRMYEDLRGSDTRDAYLIDTTQYQGFTDKQLNEMMMDPNSALNQSIDWGSTSIGAYGELGVTENLFVQGLGKKVMDALGLNLNGTDSNGDQLAQNVKEAIVFGLGVEIMDEMNNMGWLRKTRLNYFNDVGNGNITPAEYLDFVDFQWNSSFAKSPINKRNKVNEFITDPTALQKAHNILNNAFRNVIYGRDTEGRDYSVLDVALPMHVANQGFIGHAARILANKKSESAKHLLGDQGAQYSGVSDKPFKATSADTSGLINTGQDPVLIANVQVSNDIEWAVDEDYYALTLNHRDVFSVMFGSVGEEYDSTEADKEARRSVTNQNTRSFDILDSYFRDDFDNMTLKDKVVYLKHHLVSTLRTMVQSDLTPQANKLHREVVYPKLYQINEDGTKEVEILDIPIKKRAKGENFSTKENLVWWTDNLAKQLKEGKADDLQVGTALAIAQALGVKVEKLRTVNALKKLSELLDNENKSSDVFALVQFIRGSKEGLEDFDPTDGIHLNMASRLYEQFGSGSYRLLKAASVMNDLDNVLRGKAKSIKPNLLIEADGIGNGTYNSLRQFATDFSPFYLHTLKRTGTVTMDMVAEEVSKGTDINDIEGSKYIFDSDKEGDKLDDVYQSVSVEFHREIAESVATVPDAWLSIPEVLRGNMTSFEDVLFNDDWNAIANKEHMANDFKNPLADKLKKQGIYVNSATQKAVKNVVSTAKLLAIVQTIGGFETSKTTKKSMDISEFGMIVNDNLKDFTDGITRALAKIGVTPATYGGKLDGITNQTIIEVNKNLKNYGAALYQSLKDYDGSNNEDLIKNYRNAVTLLKALGIKPKAKMIINGQEELRPIGSIKALKTALEGKDALSSTEISNLKSIANVLSKYTTADGITAKRNLKNTFGTMMLHAIDLVYGELYDNISFAIGGNTMMFNQFINEYLDKLLRVKHQRNIDKGWVDANGNVLDARADDSLSKKEIKHILSNMDNLPLIGTAMSKNDVLVTQLLHSGNSVLKAARVEGNVGKRTVPSTTPSNFYANHNQEDKNAQYKIFMTTMHDSWRFYKEAGAAALVQQVVSTESMSQVETARMLQELGKNIGNVFDGAEAGIGIRHMVSELINKNTLDIHLNTNLMAENFHAMNRSGNAGWIDANENKLTRLGDSLSAIKTYRDMINAAETNGLTIDDMVRVFDLLALNSRYNIDGEDPLVWVNPHDEQDKISVSQFFRNMSKSWQEYSVKTKLGVSVPLPRDPYGRTPELIGQMIDLVSDNTMTTRLGEVLGEQYNYRLDRFANKAANAEVMKYIEKKYLTQITNQFGGISNGHVHNDPSKNKLAAETMQRYIKYANEHIGMNSDLGNYRDNSHLLSEFIANDPIIREDAHKFRMNIRKKLSPVYSQANSSVLNIVGEEMSLRELVSWDEKSTQNKVVQALKPFIEKFGKETTVTHDSVSYLEATGQAADTKLGNGQFAYNVKTGKPMIYINPDLLEEKKTITVLHEMIHNIMDGSLLSYYYQPFSDDRILNKVQYATVQHLENTMLSFAKRYQQDAKFADAINHLYEAEKQRQVENREFSPDVGIRDYTPLYALTSQMVYLNSGNTGLSAEDLADAKYKNMQEMLGYGFTTNDMLQRMQYAGSTEKISVGIWDNIKDYFNKFRRAVGAIFGYSGKSDDPKERIPRSYLIEALTSMRMLGDIVSVEKNTQNLQKAQAIRQNLKQRDTVLNQLGSDKSMDDASKRAFDLFSQVTMETGDMTRTQAFDTVLENSNLSAEHKDYLSTVYQAISNSFQQYIQNDSIYNYPTETALVRDSQIATDANNILNQLQSNGIPFTEVEGKMFKLMFAVNKANFLGGNEQLRLETEQVISGIVDKLNPKDFLSKNSLDAGYSRFETVFNNKEAKDNQLAMVLALIGSNQQMREYFNNQLETNSKIGTKVKDKYRNFVMNRKANELVGSIKDQSILDQLSVVSGSMDFRNKRGALQVMSSQKHQLKAEQAKLDTYKMVEEFAEEHIPVQALRDLTKITLGAVLSGQGFNKEDTDSTIGQMIQDIVEKHDYLKGRPTLISTFIRWIRGAHEKVQYAYRMRAEFTAMNDSIKEKLGNLTNADIERSFENLDEPKRKAIKNVIMQARLHTVSSLKGIHTVNMNKVVSDAKYREQQINHLNQEISQILTQSGLTPNQMMEFMNFYNYQTSGLAEMMQTGAAKSHGNDFHVILGNTRAIASVNLYNKGLPAQAWDSMRKNHKDLTHFLSAITALKSLNHVSDSDLEVMQDMLENESKGVNKVFREMAHTDELNEKDFPDSLLGSDGYIHNKKDSNFDVQVLDPKSEEYKEQVMNLTIQGYEKVADLHNGFEAWRTDQSLNVSYNTGIFDLAEYSHYGVNTTNLRTLGSIGKTTKETDTDKSELDFTRKIQGTFDLIRTGKLSYEEGKHTVTTKPIMTASGTFVGLETGITKAQEEAWIPRIEDSFEGLGNLQARKFEEEMGHKASKEHIDELRDVYRKRSDKHNFVKVDGKFKASGNKPSDKVYEKRLNDFFNMLPSEVKGYIEQGGLFIERGELDNLIGYHKGSITDPLFERSGTPEWFNKGYAQVIAGLMKIEGLPGNPIKGLKYAERGLSEVVSMAKETVLIRSLFVPMQNLLSNMIHLVNVGIPMKEIVPLMIDGYRNAKTYVNNEKEIIRLNHSLLVDDLTKEQRIKYEAKSKLLEEQNKKNPARPLMKGGIFTSLSEASDTPQDDNQFSLWSRAKRRTGLDKVESSTPKPVSELLMMNGSQTHTAMMNLMNYGDFIAKYAQYMHLTRTKGKDSEHAMNIIRDEFVNYNMNRGKLFDMLNSLGIFWFANYKLGIQKIIYRNLRRNFLRTAAIYTSGKYAKQFGVDTVPNQVFGLDYSFYHTDPTNLPGALGSHWLWSLIK